MSTCETCRHWGSASETSTQQRSCTRYPPTAFPIPGPAGVQITCFFPITTKAHFCGEYFRRIGPARKDTKE